MSPFLHPALAWSALGLASVPVIIHLINRRRLRRVDWAAMEFLLAALRKNRRRVRLEQLILLACRVLLMVLLALFVARPLLDQQGLGWIAGALRSEEKIFVVDDSLSMAQRRADGTLFARATRATGGSLGRIARTRSRDRVTVLRTSRPDTPLVRADFLDEERAAGLEQALEDLDATSTRADLADGLESIVEHAASAESVGRSRAVSIVTDLRAADWTDGAGGPNAELAAALERLTTARDRPTRIVLLDVGTSEIQNVCVESVEVPSGRPVVGIPARVRVGIANHGRRPVRGVRVRLSYAPVREGEAEPSMALAPPVQEVPPGERTFAEFQCAFRSPGQYQATVEISGAGDTLIEDDELSFVVEVSEAVEVLLVNGEPSSERFEGETDFLASALRPSGEASSGIAPVVVVEDNLPREDLSRFAAIFIANVYRLPEDFLERLGRWVRDGGPLVLFPGDQVDPVVWHRDLGVAAGPPDEDHPARALLPATLEEVVNRDDQPAGLLPAYDHPFFEFLADGGERYVQEVSFRRWFRLEPRPGASVIARLSGGTDSPALLARPADAGRVLLFASTADTEWNDWPRTVTWLPVLQEMVRTIGHREGRRPIHAAGSRIEVPIDITEHDPRGARWRGPEYPATPERELIASADPDDPASYRLEIDETSTAGLGRLRIPRRDGGSELRAFAVRSEPAESDLRRVRPEDLGQLYPDVELSVVRDVAGFSETGRGRFEVADLLIALFGGLLLVEGALACWFAHHRRRDGSGASPAGGRTSP